MAGETGIQITDELREEADARFLQEVDGYRGKLGQVYLPIERELQQLKAEAPGAQGVRRDHIESRMKILSWMKTILDMDLKKGAYITRMQRRNKIRFTDMNRDQKIHYDDVIEKNILNEVSLSEALAVAKSALIEAESKLKSDNIQDAMVRRAAASKLVNMIERLIDKNQEESVAA